MRPGVMADDVLRRLIPLGEIQLDAFEFLLKEERNLNSEFGLRINLKTTCRQRKNKKKKL